MFLAYNNSCIIIVLATEPTEERDKRRSLALNMLARKLKINVDDLAIVLAP